MKTTKDVTEEKKHGIGTMAWANLCHNCGGILLLLRFLKKKRSNRLSICRIDNQQEVILVSKLASKSFLRLC